MDVRHNAAQLRPGGPYPLPQLKPSFTDYQASLNLSGKDSFGAHTAKSYATYLLQAYLVPSANKYLAALSETDRSSYLAKNTWITWSSNTASFTFADFVSHVGRMKSLPVRVPASVAFKGWREGE
ncbi:MAG: hypothetical protein AB2L14_13705 [Candidatus Xenobiia bacterium LiM19]